MGRKLIYLDDALDRIREYCGGAVDKPTAKRILLQMDTVEQPDVPDTNVGDTISRQSAIDELNHADDMGTIRSILDVLDVLRTLPSAQPEKICVAKVTMTDEQVQEVFEKAKADILAAQPERKKGKWINKKVTEDFHVIGQCSVCKKRRRIDNFCPNCGAKMEIEE